MLIFSTIKIYLKISESNISSSVLGTLFLIKSLKISDLIFYYKVRVNRMSTDLKSSPVLTLLFLGESS